MINEIYMVEQIQELPDFETVYDSYIGRRPDVPEKEVPLEPIEMADRKKTQEAMDFFAENMYSKYEYTKENDPNARTRAHENVTKTNVFLGETVVDASVPLTMSVYKTFLNENGRKAETINFYLYKGQEDSEEFVGNISIADRGEEGVDVIDRFVDPKFRKQGFGTMFFNCADAFIQKVANERQKPVKAFANMSQLTVIYQFWKHGYRPETDEDWSGLDMALSGHDDLELAERYFLFKKDTPDADRYFPKPSGELEDEKIRINYNNAFRIKMVKKFEAGLSENVEDLRRETEEATRGI